jgi:hypothetical protein
LNLGGIAEADRKIAHGDSKDALAIQFPGVLQRMV